MIGDWVKHSDKITYKIIGSTHLEFFTNRYYTITKEELFTFLECILLHHSLEMKPDPLRTPEGENIMWKNILSLINKGERVALLMQDPSKIEKEKEDMLGMKCKHCGELIRNSQQEKMLHCGCSTFPAPKKLDQQGLPLMAEATLNIPRGFQIDTSKVRGPSTSVEHPAHYNQGKYEVIDVIEDWKMGFNLGNALKYIARAGKKDPLKELEDLKKAKWYLEREIKNVENRAGMGQTEAKFTEIKRDK